MEGVADVFRHAVGVVDLRHPLRHLAEHAPVVDLLEGLALAQSAATWPMNRIIGVESWKAVCTPIVALVAPGPRVTKQTPGSPVSLP